MDLSMVIWAVVLSMLVFAVLVASFFGGMALGMRIGSGGTRGILGVVKGRAAQAEDPEFGAEDSTYAALQKAFGNGWAEEGGGVEPPGAKNQRVAAQEYDDALKMADRQVQRFLDSTVFGAGPKRARSGEADDDE